jgi:hypothetical protein
MVSKIITLLSAATFLTNIAFGQNPCNSDICVVQFNANWNGSNSVDYLTELKDCSVMNVDIGEGTWQKDFGIVVVPTVIVFNGKEVERFQADISFKIAATRKDVQGVIDDIIYSDF